MAVTDNKRQVKILFNKKSNCQYCYWQLVIEATRSSVRYVSCWLNYPYWNKVNMFCFDAFACDNIAIEACCRTCVLARFAVSVAKSASTIRPFD